MIIKPKLYGYIEQAFRSYETEQQKTIFVENRPRYSLAFFEFFSEVFTRIDDANFVDSFYEPTSKLYVSLDSGGKFAAEIITRFVSILEQDSYVLYEMTYGGQKNAFDAIIRYALTLLSDAFNLTKIDSAKLLRLIDHYDYHIYETIPPKTYLKRGIRPTGTSRFLKKRFEDIHKDKVYYIASRYIGESDKINRVISDSAELSSAELGSADVFNMQLSPIALKNSWGGDGDSIFYSCRELHGLVARLGLTQDSHAASINLVEKYLRLLKVCSFGANFNYEDFIVNSENLFGRFNRIAQYGETDSSEIWGLKFLEPLLTTRSFLGISPGIDPIQYLFKNGIKNRLEEGERLGKKSRNSVPTPLSLYLINALRKAQNIGWNILTIHNSLNEDGRLIGYEGLGSLKYPTLALSRIFPTKFNSDNQSYYKGLTGALDYLTTGVINSEEHIYHGSVPSKTFETLGPWLSLVKNKIETIISTIEVVGYKTGDIIPNIPLSISSRSRQDFERYFLDYGYSPAEADLILNSKSLSDLVSNFADRMSSADVKSFINCYDLCSLVYGVAGEAGIAAVLEYLYAPGLEGFARVYNLLEKKQSRFIKLDSFKYGKLVGVLYSVLRISDKNYLDYLTKILSNRNSTIGESLKIISELDLRNPIKSISEVDIITPLIEQSQWGTAGPGLADMNYRQALSESPFALREWAGLIQKSAGFATQQDLIVLFDSMSGVTYDQLISILRLDANPGLSILSGILDGARGSEFTRIVRDFYMSGLALLSRDTTSSFKRPNTTAPAKDFYLADLVQNLKSFVIDIELINYRLLISNESNIVNKEVTARDGSFVAENIINSTNKPLNSLSKYVETLTIDSRGDLPYKYNSARVKGILDENGVAEPPGIGNSPRIPRRFKPNTLTPELAFLLNNQPTASSIRSRYLNSPQSYIKVARPEFDWKEPRHLVEAQEQKYIFENEATQDPQTPYLIQEDDQGGFILESQRPVFSTYVNSTPAPEKTDYVESLLKYPISNPVRGSYILEIDKDSVTNNLQSPYDPIKECEEFGTSASKCRELFKDYENVACPEYADNRSTLIEDNSIQAPSKPGSVVIDRPLGVSAGPNPSARFVPNYYKEPPIILENYKEGLQGLDENGEPLGGIIIDEADVSQVNSYVAIKQYVNKYGYPIDEKDCSRRSNTADLQKCLTVIMCRKLPKNNRPLPCRGIYHE